MVLVVLVVALVVGTGPAAWAQVPGGRFVDDDGDFHEGAIQAIAGEEITTGCDAARLRYFCPDEVVIRGQMASFLARAFDLPPASEDFFPDDAGFHEDNINRVAEAGIALGFSDGTFRPSLRVTRAQMASFLARALDLEPLEGDRFDDVEDTPHEGNINAIAEEGITEGCNPEGTLFCPDDPVPRAQMATFLARALELTLDPPPMRTQESCVTSDAHDPSGELVVVPGNGRATGAGILYTYRVEVEEGLVVDHTCVARVVEGILFDARGWTQGSEDFRLVDGTTAETRLILASAGTATELCQPLDVHREYSCRVGELVVLNFDRWQEGAEGFESLAVYRAYLINHEVGHRIGEDHWNECPEPGGPAPVMMQQTIEIYGECVANAWPLPAEVD